jgi:hypothetical protein
LQCLPTNAWLWLFIQIQSLHKLSQEVNKLLWDIKNNHFILFNWVIMLTGHISSSESVSCINLVRLSAKPGSLYNNHLMYVLRVDVGVSHGEFLARSPGDLLFNPCWPSKRCSLSRRELFLTWLHMYLPTLRQWGQHILEKHRLCTHHYADGWGAPNMGKIHF